MNALNHRIRICDQHRDELRDAFAAAMVAVGTAKRDGKLSGEVSSALELLMACKGADDELRKCAAGLREPMVWHIDIVMDTALDRFRSAFAHCQAVLDAEREALLAPADT